MSQKDKTIPNVFIVESMSFEDEKYGDFEGDIIAKILRLSGIGHRYEYVRTSREFFHYLDEFKKSNFRYLHISCHGRSSAIKTTFDIVKVDELIMHLENVLDKKRLFLSSCSIGNSKFAAKLFNNSTCYSVIGCDKKVSQKESAIFWASFYYKMFNRERNSFIKHDELKLLLKALLKIYTIPLKFFHVSKESNLNYKEVVLKN